MGMQHFSVFLVSALIFAMTPGLDTVLILNRSLTAGRGAGLYSTLGINAGALVHTLLAAFGLSLLIARSAPLFMALRYAGTVYLIYLGASKMLSRNHGGGEALGTKEKAAGPWYCFLTGITTNLLNPKVILFFLAFFPQFVHPDHIDNPLPYLILGSSYAVIGLGWYALVSLFASAFSARLLRRRGFKAWMERVSGALFVLMGVRVFMTK